MSRIYYDWQNKRHPPGGPRGGQILTVTTLAHSHSLQSQSDTYLQSVCDSTRILVTVHVMNTFEHITGVNVRLSVTKVTLKVKNRKSQKS